MTNECPVCFQPLKEPVCPHCGTDLRPIRVTRALETLADGRDTLNSLKEVLSAYRRMDRPQAAGRVMSKLAEYCLKMGMWREARHYFEQILALGDKAGAASFRAANKRQLGALLGRIGEMPLGLHLLGQAEHAGDSLALVERLRLETEAASKQEALASAAQLEKSPQRTRQSEAWRMEALARFDALADETKLKAMIKTAESSGDTICEAVLRRAWAVWQINHEAYKEAQINLQRAIDLFGEQLLLYERSRTQVDLARAYLLSEMGSLTPTSKQVGTSVRSVMNAQTLLDKAITSFRLLGTPLADASATQLLNALSIGRISQTPTADATSTSVALIWLSLEGNWSDEIWKAALETIQQQGGLGEKMLGGIVGLFGAGQHHGDLNLIVETAFALYDLLVHYRTYHKDKVESKSTFRVVAALGMLPQDEQDSLSSVRRLGTSRLFQETRAQVGELGMGLVAINEMLYLATRENYTFTPLEVHSRLSLESTPTSEPPSEPKAGEKTDPARQEDAKDPRWWQLSLPQKPVLTPAVTKRYRLQGYETIFDKVDTVLKKFKGQQEGAYIMLSGLPGTGKTRLLELFSHELQASTPSWLIHLRGRESQPDQPFSAIRHWLGSDMHQTANTPRERRLSYIATFRRSVVGLLTSKPLILLIDDVHLLDSGSLATLKAVLPLTASHRLIMLMTARPQQGADEWESLVEVAHRALPERSLHVRLPDALAYVARPLPDDLSERHVLACAAVLGDHFSTSVLRRASGTAHLERHLKALESAGVVQPADKVQNWRFTQTAERDALYTQLDGDYRAVVHWYARQTLKKLGLPSEDHVHPAGIADPALKISIRNAQKALELDCPIEALLHFDRALNHYQGEREAVDLLMARAGVLLNLNRWTDAMEALAKVESVSGLTLQEEANLLIYQGELNYRVGEVATLFRLYEQAAEKLRQLPTEEADPADQISIQYAQALARFKRGEVEMARSMTGGALLMAQQANIEGEMAHLWELLASIHQARGEISEAQKAIEKAITSYKNMRQQWQLMEPLERFGQLTLASGSLEAARKLLQEALDLAEAIGDAEAMIHLHHQLSQIAMYRGEFGKVNGHLSAALKVALFAENHSTIVMTRAALAEGLGLEGKQVDALGQATLALELATQEGEPHDLAVANLALGRVALAFNCLDDAENALEKVKTSPSQTSDLLLRLKLDMSLMELALGRNNLEDFDAAWTSSRNLHLEKDDLFLRARIGLLIGKYFSAQKEWNDAAREIERASKSFVRLGAAFWYTKAKTQLREISANAPGYHHTSHYHLRGRTTGSLKRVEESDLKDAQAGETPPAETGESPTSTDTPSESPSEKPANG